MRRSRSRAPAARRRRRVQAERDVVGQRVREEKRLLRNEPDGAAQHREWNVAHVHAIDEHRARRRIVQSRAAG